jgi:hypothetical protein
MGRNRSRPRRTVRGVARVRVCGGPARPRPAQRAAHGTSARRHCPAARHQRTGDDGDGGSPATATGGRGEAAGRVRATWLRTAAVGARAVGAAAWSGRQREGRGGGQRAAGAECGVRRRCRRAWASGALSGRAARCPDSGFRPRCRRGTWRPHGSGTLPRGPSAARGG